jgi:hypothetical protein
MARFAPGDRDITRTLAEATFTAAAQTTPAANIQGRANFAVGGSGWVGTVVLERSFDGGTTYLPILTDGYGSIASFTTPVSGAIEDTEAAVLYRLRCAAYTSGSIPARISG